MGQWFSSDATTTDREEEEGEDQACVAPHLNPWSRSHEVLEYYTALASDPGSCLRVPTELSGQSILWRDGCVPFRVDPALQNQDRVFEAVAQWNEVISFASVPLC
jgi:hypothetical protein